MPRYPKSRLFAQVTAYGYSENARYPKSSWGSSVDFGVRGVLGVCCDEMPPEKFRPAKGTLTLHPKPQTPRVEGV